jgi:hypothetical protein
MATRPDTAKIAKGAIVSLRSLGIDEAYMEKFIDSDPTALGLGEVFVVERQRRQEKAGRLDLLLQDVNEDVRYEVELMLGSVDESHLIRTIEYWDIERRRYPAYDHRAVLIAEDITTRFLNVITLFSGSIPIIAIQVKAVTIDGRAAVTFFRVVDSTALRKEDHIDTGQLKPTDRAEWVSRVGAGIVELADKCLSFINEAATRQRSLNYNKYFIGLTDGVRSNNFVWFSPKKSFLRVGLTLDPVEPWVKRVQDTGLDFKTKEGELKINLTAKEFEGNKDLIKEMLREAVVEDEKE